MEAIPSRAGEISERSDLDPSEGLALRARTDADAFGELYRMHREAVFRYLRARCRDEDLAVELAAVTFEKALRGIHGYRTKGGGVLAWLLRIRAQRGRRPRASPAAADPAVADEQRSPESGTIAGGSRHSLR